MKLIIEISKGGFRYLKNAFEEGDLEQRRNAQRVAAELLFQNAKEILFVEPTTVETDEEDD